MPYPTNNWDTSSDYSSAHRVFENWGIRGQVPFRGACVNCVNRCNSTTKRDYWPTLYSKPYEDNYRDKHYGVKFTGTPQD